MESYKGLEMQVDETQKKRLIFSELFILQNKIQTKFDKILGDITSKQFIILVIVSSFPDPPSLTDVAKHAGCSRQNVKKVVAVLEKNGFLSLVPEQGTRAVRIVLQQKFFDFYEVFLEKAAVGLDDLFHGMSEREIDDVFRGLHSIEANVNRLIES